MRKSFLIKLGSLNNHVGMDFNLGLDIFETRRRSIRINWKGIDIRCFNKWIRMYPTLDFYITIKGVTKGKHSEDWYFYFETKSTNRRIECKCKM